jgi:prevent-host-death family protein
MQKATATDLRKVSEMRKKLRRGPIEITNRGKRTFVLMTTEQYDWLWAASKRSLRTEDLPETIVEAIRRAKVHPRHAHLNRLLD